jgi:hypothetical protein
MKVEMGFWGKPPPWVLLGVMLLFGAAMIIVPAVFEWQWDRGIIRDFGTAVAIAAMLGFTIDRWLKTQIAQDVFQAALGYVLPEEFREEVASIARFKFLCERHVAKMHIENVGGGNVRLTHTIERTSINISNGKEKTRAYITMDEWGFAEPSHIHECRLDFYGRSYPCSSLEKTAATITASSDYVDVPPGDKVLTVAKTSEIKRNNDDASYAYLSPTRKPEIEVTIPSDLDYTVEFGRSEYQVVKEQYGNRHIMQGTYFPVQHMRIRWWPKPTEQASQN